MERYATLQLSFTGIVTIVLSKNFTKILILQIKAIHGDANFFYDKYSYDLNTEHPKSRYMQ